MKNLILIRHAEAISAHLDMNDVNRSLNSRGIQDASFMGSLLKHRGLQPDLILSSHAVRAMSTASLMADVFDTTKPTIRHDPRIYLQGISSFLSVVHELDDHLHTVFLIGHNPGITEFMNHLCLESFTDIPTCSLVSVNFNLESWSFVMKGSGIVDCFLYPDMFPQKFH